MSLAITIFFLIDNGGNIVYSVAKEVDFATSLLLGPFAQSNLAQVYKDAQKQNSGYVAISDFDFLCAILWQPVGLYGNADLSRHRFDWRHGYSAAC